jgi:hypothetical protein
VKGIDQIVELLLLQREIVILSHHLREEIELLTKKEDNFKRFKF